MTTATSPPTRRSRPTTVLLITACTAVALVLGLLTRPAAGPLPATASGDRELATIARDVVGENRPALAVACVTPTTSRTAVIGADTDSRFEIGSISKGLTGLLFADMIERGEVTPDQELGTLLDISGPLADVTLEQLATHRSGLPAVALTPGQFARAYVALFTASNPYSLSIEGMIRAAEQTPLGSPPGTYSNIGFALLGAALAVAADRPYPELLGQRVLAPLGMADTTVPTSTNQLDERDLSGETLGGRRADPWLGEPLAPAGGVRSDVADMSVLARALLTGSAPGIDALEPKVEADAEADGEQLGWAWVITENPANGRQVTWHNGGTGGFTSFVGIDRQARTAVVVLSSVGEPPGHVTREGFVLLDRLEGCRS